MPQSIFVLGGARSGKTSRALAHADGFMTKVYIATAEALDQEMAARIARHKGERGDSWTTYEAPLELPQAIGQIRDGNAICVVDCLTLWLTNLIAAGRDVEAATRALCEAIDAAAPTMVIVSNELGLGIVPEDALSREFRDHQGRLNQAVAGVADCVEFVVAGLPLQVKPSR
ncbi:MAG: bifunctional adenosylcobinamide kinase/adenosylcobinamide-phosphate guanylyltransferase [Rhodomicrobium sp.]|nr:bifunctional adenosylcobinamide kinase/adenosylcobinamide-phosphate guanylyltransferase [Rhodomicrobium sp.]